MLRGHRQRAALAAIAALTLGVSACGSDNGSGGSSGGSGNLPAPSQEQSAQAEKKIDINAQPRDALKQGGTVRWVIDQFSTQWNYNQYNGAEASTYDVMVNAMMPQLFIADENAVTSANPNYVTKAEVTATDPKQVVTLDLNPKATWSDGVPITEKDLETQWKALNGSNKDFAAGSTTGYEQIESIKPGTSDKQAVITFSKTFGEWQSLFAPLYPAKYQSTPKLFNTAYLNKIPVTSGPFQLDKLDKTGKTVTVVPNPKWWGDAPLLDSIVYRALEGDAGIGAFANGEADYDLLAIDPGYYKRASETNGGEVRQAGAPDYRHFTINGQAPDLKDVKVRQAIMMGVNRSAITKSDLTGLNWPTILMNNHMFVNTQEGYQDNAGEFGQYNPDKANALLDEAGWKKAGQFRKKGGKELDLRFVIPSGLPVSRREGELTQAMMKDIGIKLTIDTVPSDDFFDKYILIGNYDITPFSWLGTAFPISPNKSIYISPKSEKNGTPANQQNFARVGSPEIDKLFNEALSTTDTTKARELLNQADKLIWEEGHSIIMYQRPQSVAIRSDLANVGARGFRDVHYEDIGFMK